jgi:hypothetical protein
MVLQFGYDRVGYASALLSLEKTSLQSHSFVLGAAGKRNLLSRIEKIVGIEKKIVFQFSHFMGLLAAVLCIFIFNSVLITSREKTGLSLSFNNLANPFYFFDEIESPSPLINVENHKAEGIIAEAKKEVIKIKAKTAKALSFLPENSEPAFVQPPAPELIQVAFNEAQVALSKEQAEHVKATIENTKKILSTYQWKEVEKTIGDGLTSQEKAAVKQEYLNQVKKIDWKNMETGLKAAYENINWPELDGTIKTALASVKLDSLQTKCEETLEVIDKVQAEIESSAKSTLLPFPDESMEKIQKRQAQIQTKLEEIKLIRTKKVIKL